MYVYQSYQDKNKLPNGKLEIEEKGIASIMIT